VTAHLTVEQRALARRLRSRGWGLRDIAKEIGCSRSGVDVMLRGQQRRAAKPVRWTPRAGRLSLFEREEIRFGLARGESMSAIARGLGRAPSSVTREVKANGGVEHYRVWPAYLRAEHQTARTKVTKLSQHPLLCAKVVKGLESLWSPEEISARLRREFPGDPTMQVSPETIYQSLYVQGRGELRRELARCLRSGRTTRKPQGRAKHPGPVANMVMIADRPAEVADRAVPGHWEGDLILGKDNRSAVGTLVERSTRFVLLLHLPNGHGALDVEAAMRKAITTLPRELVRSITWDQGGEMARHVDFTVKTGVPVYFCDPHSPWQRGSNENTNGLLRQYLPKSTDLSKYSASDLRKIQRSLNGRPRKTLDYMMPMEKLAELVALTA
jgi:IS30 family transposase